MTDALILDFPIPSPADWKADIEASLKGEQIAQIAKTDRSGITLQPFYTTQDRAATSDYTAIDSWRAMQRVGFGQDSQINKTALQALQYGAEGLVMKIADEAALPQLLAGVDLRFIHTHLVCTDASAAGTVLNEYISQQAWDADTLSIQLSASQPIVFWGHTLCIDASFLQNAGANATTELGAALAILVAAMEDAAQLPETVYIHVALDTQHFEQIAKLMALRSLASFILEEYGCTAKLRITCTTSGTFLSAVDEANNLVRNSLAAMSAILGGCHALDIRPYNGDEDNAFAQRMAVNQQFLLREESYMAAVGNAVSGAYFLENYSEAIAEKAYAYFQQIQAQGGWAAAQALLQEDLAMQAKSWVAEYAEGKRILLGVNKYAPKDKPDKLMPTTLPYFGYKQLNIERELMTQ